MRTVSSHFFALSFALYFFISSISKLFAVRSFRKTLEDIGIKTNLIPFALLLIPLSELIVSISVLIESVRLWGLILSMILLLSFLGITKITNKKQSQVKCNCLGGLTNEKIGTGTLIKLASLILVNIYLFFIPKLLWSSIQRDELFLLCLSSVGVILIYILLTYYRNENFNEKENENWRVYGD
ncbi:MauE/DoxX family redox-associated membrane protein [Paenibacillus sp. 598K]|uniref:MauE/DoxX family redox-associated membrane protein n=1 Tax=Paenibacillus sp. 598K TaxID=1117987 RepID=UPI0035E3E476